MSELLGNVKITTEQGRVTIIGDQEGLDLLQELIGNAKKQRRPVGQRFRQLRDLPNPEMDYLKDEYEVIVKCREYE
jgi:hypothetical protein